MEGLAQDGNLYITMEGSGIDSSGSGEKHMLSCCRNVIRRRAT
jgi:hypothetical protein